MDLWNPQSIKSNVRRVAVCSNSIVKRLHIAGVVWLLYSAQSVTDRLKKKSLKKSSKKQKLNKTMPKIKPIEKIYTDGSSIFCPAPVFSSHNFEYFSKDCLLEWLKSQSLYAGTHLYKALMEKLNS